MAYPSKIAETIKIKYFGDLLVLGKARKSFSLCKCVCGTEKEIRAVHLLEGSVTHCGCKADNRTKAMVAVEEQVTCGFKKDMLQAVRLDTERTNRAKAYCIFRCDCGVYKSFVYGGVEKLRYGSCGCFKPEIKQALPPTTNAVLSKVHFNYWTVIGLSEGLRNYVDCECRCGCVKSIRVDSLFSGESNSCGCYSKEQTSKRFLGKFKTDAVTRHPLYSVYMGMLARCRDTNRKDYKWYGGKGILVCSRWQGFSGCRNSIGFFNFLEDMEDSYEKGLEIERLDVGGDYTPSNCTWINRRSQLQNTTKSRLLFGWGIMLTVTEWGVPVTI